MKDQETKATGLQEFEGIEGTGREIDLNLIVARLVKYLWGGLAVVCFVGALFCGAWWHLGTAVICGLMYLVHEDDEEKLSDKR